MHPVRRCVGLAGQSLGGWLGGCVVVWLTVVRLGSGGAGEWGRGGVGCCNGGRGVFRGVLGEHGEASADEGGLKAGDGRK